jgi:two-component system, cell cycle sensor histidine kinase and response regulator CckA
MNNIPVIKVLLVEDDEDDFILTRDMLSSIRTWRFEVDWLRTYDAGLQAALENRHDVCLVDYRLGAQDGVELLSAALAGGCQLPIIVLTGMGEPEVDMAAMRVGAADYLVKGRLEASELERAIRYAIERKRAAAHAAFEQARLAAFGADVGLALTRSDSLDAILERCAGAMAQYLNAALAQIWIYDEEQRVLVARAGAGPLFKANASALDLPVVTPNIEELRHGEPVLIKKLAGDTNLSDQQWVERNEIASYAACPLLLEDRLVGMMSLFSTNPLTDVTPEEMASVAHGIALCIERKRSELALNATEGKYRFVVETIREIVFQMNEFGYWTFLNPAWSSATGFTVKEALGTFFLDYIHHDDRPQNRHIFLELIERKMDYCRYETRFLTKDGKTRWMEVFVQPTQNTDGTVLGLSGSLNDITERKKAEKEVQKLAAFPRVNPNPVLEFSADGSISYFNDAAKQLAEQLDDNNLLAILPPNAGQIAQESLASGQNRLRLEVVVAGRTLTWSFFPVVGSQVVHCYGADVTEVVSLEAQFRHAQKLESVGQLAAGIAHDFNNILTVIQGYSDRLLKTCQDNPSVAGQMKQISDAARRAAGLTRQLLTFSRKQVIQTRVLDLNTVLQNLGSILPRLLGEDVKLKQELSPDLPTIQADPGMIEQVVMNLAVNARDAMPKGGELRVATSHVEVDAAHAMRQVGARQGWFVCLDLADTGCGMSPEIMSRIFEPFFSTKEVGKGTGLGLATVYGIVKQHQGWIEVVSEVGVGTTSKIFLPSLGKPADSSVDTSFRNREVRGGEETILLVEDEPDLRELVREILQSYRYHVVSASTGVEAMKLWDQTDRHIDLLLTDLVMPDGMNGRELAAQLRQRRPNLKVIYTSGHSAAMAGAELDAREGLFLAKPYRPPALAQLVRECLDGTAN